MSKSSTFVDILHNIDALSDTEQKARAGKLLEILSAPQNKENLLNGEDTSKFNEDELKDISGIGPVKIDKYGMEILDIVKNYVEENNIIPKWEYKKRLKLILDGDSRKDNEIALDLLNQGKSLEYVCEELEISIYSALTYIYDYIKEGNIIKFDLDLKDFYDENEEIMIDEAIERFGTQKINVLKKVLPDFIKYPTIRAVLLDKMLYKVKL